MTLRRFLHKIKMGPKWAYSNIAYFAKWLGLSITKNWPLAALSSKMIPIIWRLTGVKIDGRINIGYDVYYDVGYAHLITINDGVWIASRCLLLCHKRIINDYCVGDDYNALPYKTGEIILEKGCCIGMGSIIMPGVTIGEGSIIAAGSVVTRDIPSWVIASGNPCVVKRKLESRIN